MGQKVRGMQGKQTKKNRKGRKKGRGNECTLFARKMELCQDGHLKGKGKCALVFLGVGDGAVAVGYRRPCI